MNYREMEEMEAEYGTGDARRCTIEDEMAASEFDEVA